MAAKTNKKPFDSKKFKKGISWVESDGGKNLWNNAEGSSATGKYQFVYDNIKHLPEMKGMTREQFRDSGYAQEQVMDMALNNEIKDYPGYYKNAEDLTAKYKKRLGNKWKYRPDEVAAISHFLGRQGARNYFNDEYRGKSHTTNQSTGKNLSVGDYLSKYNAGRNMEEPSKPLTSGPNDVQYPAYDQHANYSERVKASRTEGRPNPDGTHSSVLMMNSDKDAFPSLFQNEDKTWTELPWREAKKRAKSQNELYSFDSEKEAQSFAEGSWKEKSPVPNPLENRFALGGHLGPDDPPIFVPAGFQPTNLGYPAPKTVAQIAQDNRSNQERNQNIALANKINNSNVVAWKDKPLVYLNEPFKIMGDFVDPFIGMNNNNPFPTSREDARKIAMSDEFGGKGDIPTKSELGWQEYAPGAAMNVGMATLTATNPAKLGSVMNESVNPFAGMGSTPSVTDFSNNIDELGKEISDKLQAVKNSDIGTAVRRSGVSKLDKELDRVYRYQNKVENEIGNIENRIDEIAQKIRYSPMSRELHDLRRVELDKLTDARQRIDEFKKYKFKLENGVLSKKGETGKLGEATNTGSKEITDFTTGNKVNAEVNLPGKRETYKLEGKNVKKETHVNSDLEISPEYKATLKKNINHIQTNIPGAKVFGSSVGVAEGNLPHLTNDYDLLISRADYDKHVKGKMPFKGAKGPAQQHQFGENLGEEGLLDFNIIESLPNGMADGGAEIMIGNNVVSPTRELFRNADPERYYAAAKEAMKDKIKGGKGIIKIPYTPKQLMDKLDPTTKTIMDAYESSKPKHINKIDSYINYGDTKAVLKGQEAYVKSLLGGRGTIGHQFPKKQFEDIVSNSQILRQIKFKGDANVVAKSPERMQLVVNDYFINNSILSREVTANASAEAALKNWDPGSKGGNAMGAGLNHVTLGDSQWHGGVYGHKQLGLKLDLTNPLEYIKSIRKQTDGRIPFTKDEISTVKKIINEVKEGMDNTLKFRDEMMIQSATPADLIRNVNTYDLDKKAQKEILNRVSSETGIRSVKTEGFGNSLYSSTLSDFDEAIDVLEYSLKEHAVVPKSLHQRQLNLDDNQQLKNVEITRGRFQKIQNFLKGGLEKLEAKRSKAFKEYNRLDKITHQKSMEMGKKKYSKELEDAYADYALNNKLYNDLRDKYSRVNNIQEKITKSMGLAVAGGVGAGAIGTVSYLKGYPDNPLHPNQLADIKSGFKDTKTYVKYVKDLRRARTLLTKPANRANIKSRRDMNNALNKVLKKYEKQGLYSEEATKSALDIFTRK